MTISLQASFWFLLVLIAPVVCHLDDNYYYYAWIDDCSPNPCHNAGSCTDGFRSFTCICPEVYTGDLCQVPLGPGRAVVREILVEVERTGAETPSCGDPPSYPYATSFAIGIESGDSATYTCPDDFALCVYPDYVTCSAGGWSSLDTSNVCERSTFSGNLDRGYLYPTPCQPSTYIRLTFDVYVYGPQSSLEIKSGNDILFKVEFVRYGRFWYTQFLTNAVGTWNMVWYEGRPFYLNTPTEITITLEDGVYTFTSLGVSVLRPEPLAGASPETFIFSDGMAVSDLRMEITPPSSYIVP